MAAGLASLSSPFVAAVAAAVADAEAADVRFS